MSKGRLKCDTNERLLYIMTDRKKLNDFHDGVIRRAYFDEVCFEGRAVLKEILRPEGRTLWPLQINSISVP